MTKEIGNSDLIDAWAYSGTKTEPDSSKKDAGWLAGERPAFQYFNWMLNLYAKQINYLLRSGIPEFNAATTYVSGDIVVSGGLIYQANTGTTGNTPPHADWDDYVADKISTAIGLIDADDIAYDNATSGATATDVQAALDELFDEKLDSSNIYTEVPQFRCDCYFQRKSNSAVEIVPVNGNKLAIYNTSAGQFIMEDIPAAGVEYDASAVALTANSLYYVYALMSGSTMELTFYGDVPVKHDHGIYVHPTHTHMTFVGMAKTGTSGMPNHFDGTGDYTASQFNRKKRVFEDVLGSTATNASTTLVQADSGFLARFPVLPDSNPTVKLNGNFSGNGGSVEGYAAIALDGTTVSQMVSSTDKGQVRSSYNGSHVLYTEQVVEDLSIGEHYITALMATSNASWAAFLYGGASYTTYLQVEIEG